MTEEPLTIKVFYQEEDFAVQSILRELDDLDMPYERLLLSEASEEDLARLSQAAGRSPESPTVEINGEVLVAPTPANVMSAIMHARSGGFYQ